jgi:acetyl-CoA C-acetyltransferase
MIVFGAVACGSAGLSPSELDLIEINEASAAGGITSTRHLDGDPDRVDVNGGGTGVAALCGGGGRGDALILRVPARVPST